MNHYLVFQQAFMRGSVYFFPPQLSFVFSWSVPHRAKQTKKKGAGSQFHQDGEDSW